MTLAPALSCKVLLEASHHRVPRSVVSELQGGKYFSEKISVDMKEDSLGNNRVNLLLIETTMTWRYY